VSTKALLLVVTLVAVLLAAAIYLHRPRGAETPQLPMHGSR
jgi:hypothetical protein